MARHDRWLHLRSLLVGVAMAALPARMAAAQTATVAHYHRTPDHAGMFVVPGLTPATVAATQRDAGFNGAVSGVINAAPLYWRPSGASSGHIIVATENDIVYALEERTGLPAWQTNLGTPATPASGCGNIDPLGVTGTPVIDEASGTLYVAAVVEAHGGPVHQLFALSLANGAIRSGWPVGIGAGMRALGLAFADKVQEQRGALALLDGNVYVPFGGYDGDCGRYHGLVVGVGTSTPGVFGALSTAAQKGGVWAPGGIASDGRFLYYATGNTARATSYGGGEAIVRADPSLSAVTSPGHFFSPADWRTLDDEDLDMGGVSPTLIDLPGSTPAHLALGLGKDGNAFLLNRFDLGGVSHALETLKVSGLYTHGATARYVRGSDTIVVFNAQTPFCSGASEGIVALRIAPGSPPRVFSDWCTPLSGRGDPIVTTTDGTHDPIVWATGAEGDEGVHAYDGGSGAALFASPPVSGTIRHYTTPLVANGRLFVTSDNEVLAYTLGGAR